jgi:hypothetical protein
VNYLSQPALNPDKSLIAGIQGFGGGRLTVGTGLGNNVSFAETATDWVSKATADKGISAVQIDGFTAANKAGFDVVSSGFDGGFAESVNPTATSLLTLGSGGKIEIASGAYQQSVFTDLTSVAYMLQSLKNVSDGIYYIIIYDGAAVSNAGLYIARATAGNGFNFADTNGILGDVDTDSVELVAVFHSVGADAFTGSNFI